MTDIEALVARLEACTNAWYRDDAHAAAAALREQAREILESDEDYRKLREIADAAMAERDSLRATLATQAAKIESMRESHRASVAILQDAFESRSNSMIENDRVQRAQIEALRGLIQVHNDEGRDTCGRGDQEGVRCKYRPYFPRHCPECPLDSILDMDSIR